MDRGSTNAAASILEQAEKSLKGWNKIIYIADKYDLYVEYMHDPITENTDDATKLRQAEYCAKIKRREKVRQRIEQVLIIEVQIPKEQRLIFFVVLAQHIQRKHLEVKEQQLQPPVTCIANQNIMVEKRTRTLNVSIATEKDTGLTNAHERHPDSHQQPNTSKETVKYNFLMIESMNSKT